MTVTALIPSNRREIVGVQALLAQRVPTQVRVLWNGEGIPVVPGAQVERVAWRGHGRTRQDAIADVTTPYVLFTVDDALVLGSDALGRMIKVLETGFDAVWARQVPWPDAPARVRARLQAWCPATGEAPKTRLDHVCALYRTETLRHDPLDDVPIAEDWAWGRRHRCALVPDAVVMHSHAPSLGDAFLRTKMIHSVMYRMGETPHIRSGLDGARAILGSRDRVELGEALGQIAAAQSWRSTA